MTQRTISTCLSDRKDRFLLTRAEPPFKIFFETYRIGRLDVALATQGFSGLIREFLLSLCGQCREVGKVLLVPVGAGQRKFEETGWPVF